MTLAMVGQELHFWFMATDKPTCDLHQKWFLFLSFFILFDCCCSYILIPGEGWILTGLKTGFIKTTEHRPTDHRPTDPPTTYHLPTDPPTTYPPTHWPTIINLGWNRRPDSEHVLPSIILENFKSCTVLSDFI